MHGSDYGLSARCRSAEMPLPLRIELKIDLKKNETGSLCSRIRVFQIHGPTTQCETTQCETTQCETTQCETDVFTIDIVSIFEKVHIWSLLTYVHPPYIIPIYSIKLN